MAFIGTFGSWADHAVYDARRVLSAIGERADLSVWHNSLPTQKRREGRKLARIREGHRATGCGIGLLGAVARIAYGDEQLNGGAGRETADFASAIAAVRSGAGMMVGIPAVSRAETRTESTR